jgi:hypothetical protein
MAEREKPKVGNLLGIMYKGGFLVPVILTMLMMVIVFSIERLLTLARATGNGNLANFVRKVQYNLANNNVEEAVKECDRQKGSVANVIKSGLKKYSEMAENRSFPKNKNCLLFKKKWKKQHHSNYNASAKSSFYCNHRTAWYAWRPDRNSAWNDQGLRGHGTIRCG